MIKKIASVGLIDGFLEKYNIWRDHENFYRKQNHLEIAIDPTGIPCYPYQDLKSINNSNSPVVLIDCLTEGLHSQNTFSQYKHNCHYLIFSNGNWDKNLNPLPISYDIVHHNFFLFEMADTYLSPNRFCFYLDKNYNFDYPKEVNFVSTIGLERQERDLLVNHLLNTLDKKTFILRYAGQDRAVPYTNDVIAFAPGKFTPWGLVSPDLEKYYHHTSQTLPIDLYNKGYFNLVVESDINLKNDFFLTEKTIKSLLTGIPFVVCSTPYFIKGLKQLGFLTYSDVWNESYDNIENTTDRIDAIAKLCIDLVDFDWESNKEKLQRIAEHNRCQFFNLNSLAHSEFVQFESLMLNICEKYSL